MALADILVSATAAGRTLACNPGGQAMKPLDLRTVQGKEALRIGRGLILRAIKDEGQKVSWYTAKDIRKLTVTLVKGSPEVQTLAKRRVAKQRRVWEQEWEQRRRAKP